MKHEVFGFDAYSPAEIAERVQKVCVIKAHMPLLTMWMLAVLAGAFIGLGALFFTLVISDHSLGFANSRVLGGVCFSLGLILVVVAGAELFTGNNLLVMAWAEGCLTTRDVLRDWTIVGAGNFVGAAGLAVIVYLSGYGALNNGEVARTAVQIAMAKCALPFWEAFFRGVLCNVLVCMAVWMAMAGRSVIDKAVAIIFPVSAFVAAGFEHSIANMYFIPLGMLLRESLTVPVPGAEIISGIGLARNLVPVILGNLMGGSVLVALVYYVIYRRGRPGSTLPAGSCREAALSSFCGDFLRTGPLGLRAFFFKAGGPSNGGKIRRVTAGRRRIVRSRPDCPAPSGTGRPASGRRAFSASRDLRPGTRRRAWRCGWRRD